MAGNKKLQVITMREVQKTFKRWPAKGELFADIFTAEVSAGKGNYSDSLLSCCSKGNPSKVKRCRWPCPDLMVFKEMPKKTDRGGGE